MDKIIKKAYAKINLFLDVVSRYPDGYHEVRTVMQSVSLCDDVEIELCEKGIYITCDNDLIPKDNRNIAWKAADLFFKEAHFTDKIGVKINITKRIPIAAGLAGGSADAAAVLCGINELAGRPLSWEYLISLGATLGADIPFCMEGGTAYADAKGDKLHTLASLENVYFVIACGGEGVSTPWAYRELDIKFDGFSQGAYTPRDVSAFKEKIARGDVSGVYNVFEEAILPFRPVARQIKDILNQKGALCALMSGSGPSVFGMFDDVTLAEQAALDITSLGYFAHVATPIKKNF